MATRFPGMFSLTPGMLQQALAQQYPQQAVGQQAPFMPGPIVRQNWWNTPIGQEPGYMEAPQGSPMPLVGWDDPYSQFKQETLPATGQALSNGAFNPMESALDGLAGPGTTQRLATYGPEDAGKSQLRTGLEQLAGNTLQLPGHVAHALLDPWAGLGQHVVTNTAQGLDYLASDVPASDFAPPQQEAPQGQGASPVEQGLAGPQAQQGLGSPALTIPYGPQPQMPQMPQMAQPDYGKFMAQMQHAGPSGAVPQVPYVETPNPIAPDTAPMEKWLAALNGLEPEGPDMAKRKQGDLIGMLGALAAGAGSGDGSLVSVLAGAGASGAKFHLQRAQQNAEEDKDYRQAKLGYLQAQLQGQMQLGQIQHQYAQAIQDTQTGNAEKQAEAHYRTQVLQQQAAEAQQNWQAHLAELGFHMEEEQTRATNAQLDRQFEYDLGKYKIDAEASKPKVVGDNLYQEVAQPDGSKALQIYKIGQTSGTSALFKLAGQEGIMPGAQKTLEHQANFALALERKDPAMAQEVVADSLVDQAPELFGEGFDAVQAKIQQKAMQLGHMPGNSDYAKFYTEELKSELMKVMNEPGQLDFLAKQGNPYARYYLKTFGGQ